MIFNRTTEKERSDNDMSLVFLSLLLVLITFFIVLTRFVETDPQKVTHFKQNYSHVLFFVDPEKVTRVMEQNEAIFEENNPIQSLINRMKAIGITEPLMNQFLNLTDITTLKVISGQSGLVLRLPKPIQMDGDLPVLNEQGRKTLEKLAVLFFELPYIIEIKGVGVDINNTEGFKTLEKGVMASQSVYRQLLLMGVIPGKIKISGTTDKKATEESTFVELAFRENV